MLRVFDSEINEGERVTGSPQVHPCLSLAVGTLEAQTWAGVWVTALGHAILCPLAVASLSSTVSGRE